MKTAKANKLIILITAFVLSVVALFLTVNLTSASAEAGITGSDVFEYTTSTSHSAKDILTDENDNMVIPFKSGEIIRIKSKVVLNNFGIELQLPKEFTKITYTIKASSYDVTKTSEVENVLEVIKEGDAMSATFNGGTATALGNYVEGTVYKQSFKVENNLVQTYVGINDYNEVLIPTGASATPTVSDTDYRVESADKTVASITIKVESSADCSILFKSVTQNINDDKYKLTFETEAGKLKKVYPRYELNKDIINFGESKNVMFVGSEYGIRGVAYSLFEGYADTEIGVKVIAEGGDYVLNPSKMLRFNKPYSNAKIQIVKASDNTVVYDEYTVDFIETTDDSVAPEYNADALARQRFVESFTEDLFSDKDNGIYVALGTNQYLTLPSMQNLVSDNVTPYSKLKYTVYYENANTSSQATDMKIPLNAVGEYKFYVVFEDMSGNKMDVEKFKKVSDTDSNVVNYDLYDATTNPDGNVFTFTVVDNHPMTVTAPSTQSNGYIEVSYTASSFVKSYLNATESYKLFYSPTKIDKNAQGWVEIPQASKLSDDDSIEGFTNEQVKQIAYNGNLTFTPIKAGYYKIECTLTSNFSSNSVSEASIITVEEKPTIVKPDSKWLQNNVWSVVFLSVGTLSLIGIIVLLCIKPKDKNDD